MNGTTMNTHTSTIKDVSSYNAMKGFINEERYNKMLKLNLFGYPTNEIRYCNNFNDPKFEFFKLKKIVKL